MGASERPLPSTRVLVVTSILATTLVVGTSSQR
jgi:hypothetical protein